MFLLSKLSENKANLIRESTESKISDCKGYDIGEWNLKVFEGVRNKSVYQTGNKDQGGVLIGTPMYKNLPLNHILNQLLTDFLTGKLELDQLKGNYIFILWRDEKITILNDKLGEQSIFHNEISSSISSSFLLLLRNSNHKFKINQNALQEKLSTGFNLGSETLVNGIRKILPNNPLEFPVLNNINWAKHEYKKIDEIRLHDKGRDQSLNDQANQLGGYFTQINNTFKDQIGDLGLSSGFDCRLILSLADKHIDNKLHLHSHNTKGVHDTEIKYAKEIAELYRTQIDLIPTERLEKYEDKRLEEILTENLNFFDGISARHLGAYSETYTFDYKKSTLGNSEYSLNGLGGEIYRDSYFTGSKKMNWNDWVNRYIFLPFSEESVGSPQQLNNTSDYIRSKLEKQLDVDFDKMDMFSTHAYYGLIKMPQCNGSVASAYGKASPFLMPFIEYDNVIEALKATPYLGIGGQYQAELITRTAPALAKVGSHYGFSFDSLSTKYLVWSKLKTLGSVKRRNKLVKNQLIKRMNSSSYSEIINMIREKKVLNKAKEVLLDYSPHTDFDKMLIESTQRRYIIYLGFMLKELSDYIEK
ncbi:hypothetical protein [Brumimicrobium oceani]|uniref:asparagine synthase (glutamine-hydrolyzing) n=1 Tax=Brumimicrobium oceani TaxID=2100725 RepID=A0A2U2XF30_9FLAO|nr:hypothetical protein [Brumimicrobium oceani]PWH86412.1 hypothetical protein DIT68_04010 [Brumimicrobium oceani]